MADETGADAPIEVTLAEGEMSIGNFKTKGFRLYSITFAALLGLLLAIAFKVEASNVAIIAVIASNLIGMFTGKKS